VKAEPAAVPLSSYLRFVDAPDVTAAIARHLGLTTLPGQGSRERLLYVGAP
jgi:hypothetical protein